ncbi:MAG: serine/threonine-protein kinase [Acidobacteriota bacterium]
MRHGEAREPYRRVRNRRSARGGRLDVVTETKMSLAIGTRLGSFEIVASLGAGGMGEVYRARDTTLHRDVAIKILPALSAADAERLARFTREAQALAALNHPHIAQIYGFEQTGETRALVMVLVDGEDLAVRLTRGAVPLDEALPIARQIAEALEAAHEAGIIHRDLKPANIKVRSDGTVKVLDFGLAKALDPAGTSAVHSPLNSPTFTSPPAGTVAGMILGTAAYMAPEQARGKAVDKRADIWAFGVVLFEMLTGGRLFEAENVTDTLAGVLAREPDLSTLPADTPSAVHTLLRWCLAKDSRERLRDIGDAKIVLGEIGRPGPVERQLTPILARAWIAWSVAALAGVVATWAMWTGVRATSNNPAEGHFTIELPDNAPLVTLEIPGVSAGPLAVSPDGRQVVYVAPNGSRTRDAHAYHVRGIEPGSGLDAKRRIDRVRLQARTIRVWTVFAESRWENASQIDLGQSDFYLARPAVMDPGWKDADLCHDGERHRRRHLDAEARPEWNSEAVATDGCQRMGRPPIARWPLDGVHLRRIGTHRGIRSAFPRPGRQVARLAGPRVQSDLVAKWSGDLLPARESNCEGRRRHDIQCRRGQCSGALLGSLSCDGSRL